MSTDNSNVSVGQVAGCDKHPIRVLHVHAGNLFGGIETTMVAQARHARLFPDLELSFALCFEGRLSKELLESETRVYKLNNTRVRYPWTVLHARRRLKKILRIQPIDLAIVHGAWAQALFGQVILGSGLPLVLWVHGIGNKRHWLERWAQNSAPDLVICNSQFVADEMRRAYPFVQSKVVYNPTILYYPLVSRDDYVNPNPERNKIRSTLNISDETVVIVQVSRMEEWKGHLLHLEALSLMKDNPTWECWFVGGPQRPEEFRYFQKVKAAASRLGLDDRVRFFGERSDVQTLLPAADVHCQPNTGPEPFGNTFIEGLLNGLPVVTTAMGGGKEIVDETCGILVPPADAFVLSRELRHLVEDRSLRRRLGAKGPARAYALCGLETQMGLLSDVLRMLLGRTINQSHRQKELLVPERPAAHNSEFF
jgi:glycosyltransferase involved in cell wall biosynthesis